jgi:hypothetical protein
MNIEIDRVRERERDKSNETRVGGMRDRNETQRERE